MEAKLHFRTNKEKREAIKALLVNPEYNELSNRRIADVAGVSEALVRSVRGKGETTRVVYRANGTSYVMNTENIGVKPGQCIPVDDVRSVVVDRVAFDKDGRIKHPGVALSTFWDVATISERQAFVESRWDQIKAHMWKPLQPSIIIELLRTESHTKDEMLAECDDLDKRCLGRNLTRLIKQGKVRQLKSGKYQLTAKGWEVSTYCERR